ncbi:phosphate ABC transporter substrate-binding protein, partial [Halorubrum sp. SD626R]
MSDRNWVDGGVSRRKVLITSGALGTAGLAGGSGSSDGGDGGSGGDGGDGGSGGDGGDGGSGVDGDDGSGQSTALLNAEGSSTVYPISNTGSSYWNSTAPPS